MAKPSPTTSPFPAGPAVTGLPPCKLPVTASVDGLAIVAEEKPGQFPIVVDTVGIIDDSIDCDKD
jgi:hypothetical protein